MPSCHHEQQQTEPQSSCTKGMPGVGMPDSTSSMEPNLRPKNLLLDLGSKPLMSWLSCSSLCLRVLQQQHTLRAGRVRVVVGHPPWPSLGSGPLQWGVGASFRSVWIESMHEALHPHTSRQLQLWPIPDTYTSRSSPGQGRQGQALVPVPSISKAH